MKTHMLSACAAAMAITLSGAATAQTNPDPLLQAQIAVTWNAPVQGLAQILAERLALPYFDRSGAAMAMVVLDQGETATVAQAMETINAQLGPANLTLRLSQGAQGQQLELTKTQSDSTVAHVIVRGPAQPPSDPASQSSSLSATGPGAVSAVPAPSAPASPTELPKAWEVTTADGTLFDALTRWADKAGWQVVWEASDDLVIPANASFHGEFRDAVRALFRSFTTSLDPRFYLRNNVVRVTDLGSRTGAKQ
ncbi:toxin co-regulated pilus biosynthesis Q family protein [Comamonas terrigena]|uniref:toxin co-regulated pilus biosynthesis Q family protein n=1 Tax=Comamonas terrigena TaxID=32013 RepID=UPI0028B13C78|nr:toxin co-regulated pilus biosynthesis Q family protein [Comamonas terrigena]